MAQLANKITDLVSQKALTYLPKLSFSGNSFSRLLGPDDAVLYSHIKGDLSEPEKNLFYSCVMLNRSYFPSIKLSNNTIEDSSIMFSLKGGYKVPNQINKFGLNKQINMRSNFKNAAKLKLADSDSNNDGTRAKKSRTS